MFTWLRRTVQRLTEREGRGLREAEYLGYEAFFVPPGIRPAGISREGRHPAQRKLLTERKAA